MSSVPDTIVIPNLKKIGFLAPDSMDMSTVLFNGIDGVIIHNVYCFGRRNI